MFITTLGTLNCITNGKKQKARPKGVKLKVRSTARFAFRFALLVEGRVGFIENTARRHRRGDVM